MSAGARPLAAVILALALAAIPFLVKPYQLDIAIFLLINILVVVSYRFVTITGEWSLAHVVMMGVGTLDAIAAELVKHGLDPRTPAATIADGTLPSQWVVRSTLGEISSATAAAGIRPPAVTVIGSVAAFDPTQPSRGSWD